jgi:hypothetical protein
MFFKQLLLALAFCGNLVASTTIPVQWWCTTASNLNGEVIDNFSRYQALNLATSIIVNQSLEVIHIGPANMACPEQNKKDTIIALQQQYLIGIDLIIEAFVKAGMLDLFLAAAGVTDDMDPFECYDAQRRAVLVAVIVTQQHLQVIGLIIAVANGTDIQEGFFYERAMEYMNLNGLLLAMTRSLDEKAPQGRTFLFESETSMR